MILRENEVLLEMIKKYIVCDEIFSIIVDQVVCPKSIKRLATKSTEINQFKRYIVSISNAEYKRALSAWNIIETTINAY